MARSPALLCPVCQTEVPYAARECVGCGVDVGFPNVRAASAPYEIAALHERVRYAQAAAESRGCANELEEFGAAASQSQAVMMRHLAVLDGLVASQQALMTSYYKLVRSGGRLPEDNEFDLNRERIDGAINPHGVYENIQFGALSLNGEGVQWYGEYAITLRESMIASRSSVFEENPFVFCDKHPIPSTGAIPPGYRATWPRRGELAMAKLHAEVRAGMTDASFAEILVEQGDKKADSDFIEVHIYGVIHPRAIERVIARAPKKGADKVIWKRTKRKLEALGAAVEEV